MRLAPSLDDGTGELKVIVEGIIEGFFGDGPNVGQRIEDGDFAVGLYDAGGDDAGLAVEAVDGQGVDGVAQPIEVAGDGGGGSAARVKERRCWSFSWRGHMRIFHGGIGDEIVVSGRSGG